MMTGTFPDNWKKASVLPVHKKESRQIKKKLQAYIAFAYLWENISKLIFDDIYEHLTDNHLLTPNQSGFCPGDLTINQLLYITHRIYAAFGDFPSRETRAVFLAISKKSGMTV